MNKQLVALGVIGILIAVGISGCFEIDKEHDDEQSEIENYAEIYMQVIGNLKLIKNVSIFDMIIKNPLNVTILIHDCFNLEKYSQENQTFEFIGRFKNYNGQFFIDLDKITKNIDECGDINLSSNEILTYNFTIQNAEEGKYKIVMAKAIMNMQSFAQSFAVSNEFTIKEQETHLKCEPTVVVTGINYSSNPNDVPYNKAHTRFKENYTADDLSIELRNTIVQNMAVQAELLRENSSILYEAIKVTYDDWEERPFMIPCYAEKALYLDEPVWIIAFNRCNGFIGDIGHFDIFYVSIQTLETQWYTGCNSSSVVYWFGCD